MLVSILVQLIFIAHFKVEVKRKKWMETSKVWHFLKHAGQRNVLWRGDWGAIS